MTNGRPSSGARSRPTPEQAKRFAAVWASILAESYPGLVFDVTVRPGERLELDATPTPGKVVG